MIPGSLSLFGTAKKVKGCDTVKSVWHLDEMDVVVHMSKLFQFGVSPPQLGDLLLQLQLQLLSLSDGSLLPICDQLLHQSAFSLYGGVQHIKDLITGLHCRQVRTLFIQRQTSRLTLSVAQWDLCQKKDFYIYL